MDALTIRNNITTMVAAFEAAERDVRAAFAAIVAAEKAVNAAFGIEPDYRSIRVSASGDQWRDDFKDADAAVEIMTRAAWGAIVERLELRRFMSIKRWEDLQKQLNGKGHEREKLPPFTVQNVFAFADGYYAQGRQMLTEAVREVFEWLRPRKGTQTGDLKTNTEMEVGERAIVGWMIDSGYGASGFKVRYGTPSQHLIALENVFNALAGNGAIAKGYRSALENAIEKSSEGETDLFEYRACKNGNLHLRFKRLDLLAKFNAIAAGKTLRPVESEDERLRREVAQARAENERLRRDAARRAA